MAAPYIPIVSTEDGAELKQYRDALEFVITRGPLIRAKMANMIDTDADPDDYTELETKYGLEGGDGATLYAELNVVVTTLQANPAEAGSTAGDAALLATKLAQFVNLVG